MISNTDSNIEDLIKQHPKIIQGGMGVGISDWNLAKIVSQNNALGVVSGTALDNVLIRRLQEGDPNGQMEHAMNNFPIKEIAERIFEEYYIPGGKSSDIAYKLPGMYTINSSNELQQLTVLANFVEVFLAKEGHNNPVGINYLEKIQMPHLHSLYGAMLADIDYVIMGAGIPLQIPGILDSFVHHKPESYNIFVENSNPTNKITTQFNPKDVIGYIDKELKRPDFLAIISSAVLAMALTKRASGKVNGFIIEESTAGGHNAPPRGNYPFNEKGEPIYGKKDIIDLEKINSFGLPWWLAGGYGSPKKLSYALEKDAEGIQVGTSFLLCDESGLDKTIKQELIKKLQKEDLEVYTDPVASPTGFPFKILSMEGTNSELEEYDNRKRICDIGYLRVPFEKDNKSIGYRCPAEPVEAYIKKGGKLEDTIGRKCLCNGLMANIDLAQTQQDNYIEQALITAGDSINSIKHFLKNGKDSYSAVDVLNYLRE